MRRLPSRPSSWRLRGWSISSFTTYSSVREKVNGVLALEIMGFALLAALAFYALSRKATLRMTLFQRDAAEMRALDRYSIETLGVPVLVEGSDEFPSFYSRASGFAAPMRAAFFENEKDGTGVMVWTRPKATS